MLGIVLKKSPTREFADKHSGELKQVQSLLIRDERDSIAVTVWGIKTSLLCTIVPGDLVCISQPQVKVGIQQSCTELLAEEKTFFRSWKYNISL